MPLKRLNPRQPQYLSDFRPCSSLQNDTYALFETVQIHLEVPYRLNQKDWKPTFKPFAKARKRVETLFSQLDDQFMVCRNSEADRALVAKNYAKQQVGLFARIISKVSAMTVLQYINFINNKQFGRMHMRWFNSANG